MLIRFVATKDMLQWNGYGGPWRDGQQGDVPDAIARRLLGLHKSPFVEVEKEKKEEKDPPPNNLGEKQMGPSLNKMVSATSENKTDTSPGELDLRPIQQDNESKGDFKTRLKEWEARHRNIV